MQTDVCNTVGHFVYFVLLHHELLLFFFVTNKAIISVIITTIIYSSFLRHRDFVLYLGRARANQVTIDLSK